jgi:hypothetical protein
VNEGTVTSALHLLEGVILGDTMSTTVIAMNIGIAIEGTIVLLVALLDMTPLLVVPAMTPRPDTTVRTIPRLVIATGQGQGHLLALLDNLQATTETSDHLGPDHIAALAPLPGIAIVLLDHRSVIALRRAAVPRRPIDGLARLLAALHNSAPPIVRPDSRP